jgi:hypothetical protein
MFAPISGPETEYIVAEYRFIIDHHNTRLVFYLDVHLSASLLTAFLKVFVLHLDDEMTSTSKSDLASKSCVEAEPVKTGSTESTELFKTGSDQSTEHVNAGSTKSDTFEEEEDSLRLYLEPDTEKTESEEDMILSSQKQPADTTIDEKTGYSHFLLCARQL